MNLNDPPSQLIASTTLQKAVFVEGQVDGTPARLLVDTGSAVTLVHQRVWERGEVARHGGVLQPPASGPVVTANGEPLTILGQTSSRIQVAGQDLPHNILVSSDVSQDCLLGADFLLAYGFVVDMASRVLSRGPSSTPLSLPQTCVPRCCRVSLGSNLVLQAGEEKLIWTNVDSFSCPTGTAGVIEPKDGLEEQRQLLVARVVTVPDAKGMAPLRMLSLSSSPLTLYRDTTIGTFYPLGEPDNETAEYREVPLLHSTALSPQQVHHLGADQTASTILGVDTTDMDLQLSLIHI